MSCRVALIHTVPPLVAVFDQLAAELLPGVTLMHVLDEPLLERILRRGCLAAEDSIRLLEHARLAEQAGARAVLVTCSTVSPCVEDLHSAVGIPVLRIDEMMMKRAVATGGRIGVLATNETTLQPTRQMLLAEAERCGKNVEVELLLVKDALPSLLKGDGSTHDRLLRDAVQTMAGRVDVIVLAQASMARVLEVLPSDERSVPVLSSPHLALGILREMLQAGA